MCIPKSKNWNANLVAFKIFVNFPYACNYFVKLMKREITLTGIQTIMIEDLWNHWNVDESESYSKIIIVSQFSNWNIFLYQYRWTDLKKILKVKIVKIRFYHSTLINEPLTCLKKILCNLKIVKTPSKLEFIYLNALINFSTQLNNMFIKEKKKFKKVIGDFI